MTHIWKQPEDPRGPGKPVMVGEQDDDALLKTVERVERISDETIERIVNRIPDEYISPQKRELIISNLEFRRGKMRDILGLQTAAQGSQSEK